MFLLAWPAFRYIRNIKGRTMTKDAVVEHLIRIESKLTRIARDLEQVKLYTGVTLAADRAVTLVANGDRIYIDPRDHGCGMNLLTEGKYEENEIGVFRSFLHPGAVVLDIGANYGYYSLVSAPYIRPGGRVVSFEPNPHMFDLLSASVYLNGYTDVITPVRCGAFDDNATLKFAVDPSGPGGARVVDNDYTPHAKEVVISVPVVKIDDFLPPDAIVDVVKLDVEGRERHVLEGMRHIIARSPNIIILMELFASFFQTAENLENFVSFIHSELDLNIYRITNDCKTVEATADDLLGKESSVVLSKVALVTRPRITFYSCQLNRGRESKLEGDALVWGPGEPNALVGHGPYVFVPKGLYRVKIRGWFDGHFTVRLQENFGDVLWGDTILDARNPEFLIALANDAPRCEIAIWSQHDLGRYCHLEKVEFWWEN